MMRNVVLLLVLGAVGYAAFSFLPDSQASTAVDPAFLHTVARGGLSVTVTELGTLESSNNTEIKCRVRGNNTITYVV